MSGDSGQTYPFGPALKQYTIVWHLACADVQEEHIKSAVRTVLSIVHNTKCTTEFERSRDDVLYPFP